METWHALLLLMFMYLMAWIGMPEEMAKAHNAIRKLIKKYREGRKNHEPGAA